MNEEHLASLVRNAWRATPWTYAEHLSRGAWLPYHHLTYMLAIVHQAILAGSGRVIVSMPPRFGKSEALSHWLPAWYLDSFPSQRVIMVSYSAHLAAHFSRKVRATLTGSDEVWVKLKDDRKSAEEWLTEEGGGFRAAGILGGLTGGGGNCIIIDDPVKNWQEASSPTYRQRVIDEYQGTISTRAEPGATIIVVMTRWGEGDLAGYLMAHDPDDWTHVTLPALAEPGDPLGRPEGAPLCPERYDLEALKATQKRLGSVKWAGLFQQRPAPQEGRIIHQDWIRYHQGAPDDLEEQWASWDLTFEGDADGSWVVGQVWGKKGPDFFLLDQYRDQVEFPGQLRAIRGMAEKWPHAHGVYIEKKANGAAAISLLKKEIPGIIPANPHGSKVIRMQAISPLFEAGNVYVPSASIYNWVPALVDELTFFPNAANDDQCDALSQALARFDSTDLVMF